MILTISSRILGKSRNFFGRFVAHRTLELDGPQGFILGGLGSCRTCNQAREMPQACFNAIATMKKLQPKLADIQFP
jgi:hypothetical protein